MDGPIDSTVAPVLESAGPLSCPPGEVVWLGNVARVRRDGGHAVFDGEGHVAPVDAARLRIATDSDKVGVPCVGEENAKSVAGVPGSDLDDGCT